MSHSNPDANAPADQDQARTLRTSGDHHAGLRSQLQEYTEDLVEAVSLGANSEPARQRLVGFFTNDLRAHLESERRVLYSAAREAHADSLAASLELEHELLMRSINQLEASAPGLESALAAHAVRTLVDLRIQTEEAVVIPMLAAAGRNPQALLADIVVEMASEHGSRFTYM